MIQCWSAPTAVALPALEMDGLEGPLRHWEAQADFLHRPALWCSLVLRHTVWLCLFCIFRSATKPRSWTPLCKTLHQHGVKEMVGA